MNKFASSDSSGVFTPQSMEKSASAFCARLSLKQLVGYHCVIVSSKLGENGNTVVALFSGFKFSRLKLVMYGTAVAGPLGENPP